jgi:hypothetical protein
LSLLLATSTLGALGTGTAAAQDPLPTSIRVTTQTANMNDANAKTWLSDRGFAGGTRSRAPTPCSPAAATRCSTERSGGGCPASPPHWANGNYSVTLPLAEEYSNAPGQRVFDVSAEGSTRLSGIDIYKAVGPKAVEMVRPPRLTACSVRRRRLLPGLPSRKAFRVRVARFGHHVRCLPRCVVAIGRRGTFYFAGRRGTF